MNPDTLTTAADSLAAGGQASSTPYFIAACAFSVAMVAFLVWMNWPLISREQLVRSVDDIRDRFSDWGTVRGLLTVAAAFFFYRYPQYIVTHAVPLIMLVEGGRLIFVNSFKAKARQDAKAAKYRGQA